jgi:energy-coupling factor transport system substrate-specific component
MTTRSSTFSMSQFTTTTIVLMAVAIAINIAVGYVVQNVLKLPIYLDSIGTVIVGILAGPLAGAATGALANIIWGLTIGPSTITPFAITAVFIGFLAGWFGSRGWFAASGGGLSWVRAAIAGVITGVVAAIVSAPIAYYVFGGTTGGGTDAVVAIFRNMTDNIFLATQLQGLASDPVDKLATFLVAMAILIAVPVTVKTTFPQGEKTV